MNNSAVWSGVTPSEPPVTTAFAGHVFENGSARSTVAAFTRGVFIGLVGLVPVPLISAVLRTVPSAFCPPAINTSVESSLNAVAVWPSRDSVMFGPAKNVEPAEQVRDTVAQKVSVDCATPVGSKPPVTRTVAPWLVLVAADAWPYLASFIGLFVRVNILLAGLKTSALFSGLPSEP